MTTPTPPSDPFYRPPLGIGPAYGTPSLGAGSAEDREALAGVLGKHYWVSVATHGYNGCVCGWKRSDEHDRPPFAYHLATIASDWLAAHVARAPTAYRERVARVEALAVAALIRTGRHTVDTARAALAAPHVEQEDAAADRRCWCGSPVGYRPDKGFLDCLADRMHDWRGKELAALAGLKEPTT